MCTLSQREILCRQSVTRVGSTMFLIPHLTSVFLSFYHVSSPVCIEICESCLPVCPQFMWQAGVDNYPWLYITLPVVSSFAARHVAHLDRLLGSFGVSYNSTSQSTFF